MPIASRGRLVFEHEQCRMVWRAGAAATASMISHLPKPCFMPEPCQLTSTNQHVQMWPLCTEDPELRVLALALNAERRSWIDAGHHRRGTGRGHGVNLEHLL